jgi:hypothetical protein
MKGSAACSIYEGIDGGEEQGEGETAHQGLEHSAYLRKDIDPFIASTSFR